MSAFLLACGLALLLVVGAVLALQPSPRQRQLARLRQAAFAAGLRVRLRQGEDEVDYLLPWRGTELDAARTTDFVARRGQDGRWVLELRRGPTAQSLEAALEAVPKGISRLSGSSEGIAARWHERGGQAEIEALAHALAGARDACLAAR